MADKIWTRRWYWSLLPLNAAVGATTTLIPLYILSLNGTVIDVALAGTCYNLALIPGALIWGHLIDFYQRRKVFIFAATLVDGFVLVAFYFTKGVSEVILLSALFSFVISATSPAANMLLMETAPKELWNRAYGRLATINTTGVIVGIIPGTFWSYYFSLRSYFLVAALFTIPALLLFRSLIKEPPITFERHTVTLSPIVLIHRLAQVPILFLKIPRPSHVRQFYQITRMQLTHELPLLFLAVFFFFMAQNIFFTAYTPFLKKGGVQDNLIFGAVLVIYLTNALTFPLAARVVATHGAKRLIRVGYAARGLCLGLAVLAAFFFNGTALFEQTTLIFIFFSIGATFSVTALSMVIFRTISGERTGELLGMYSALTALGLLLGSYLSGIISFSYGFAVTFGTALALLLLSTIVLKFFWKLPTHVERP